MDKRHSKKERVEELRKFSQKMVDSAYNKETRKEILTSGVKRYYRLVLQELAGMRKLYRSREDMKEGRKLKSLWNRTWFKSRRGGTRVLADLDHPMEEKTRKGGRRVDVTSPEGKAPGKAEKVKMVESPTFLPYTLESKLRKRLQETDDSLGEATNSPGIRFVERCGGGTLVELLTSSNPWLKSGAVKGWSAFPVRAGCC